MGWWWWWWGGGEGLLLQEHNMRTIIAKDALLPAPP